MNLWYTTAVDCIREWLADICLVGAAALTRLLAAAVCGRWLLRGYYCYESYCLGAWGGSCGCSSYSGSDPGGEGEDQASVRVSFSEDALFYEESYTNEPGVVVERRVSTNVTLVCAVNGGPYGGVFGFSKSGFDKLSLIDDSLPPEGPLEIAAGETCTWSAVYALLTHSAGENDISAEATFSERLSGASLSDEALLTVVKLKLEPQTTREGCEHRHIVGVRECVNCYAYPHVGEWRETGGGEYKTDRGYTGFYKCPLTADGSVLYALCRAIPCPPF